MGFHPNRLLVCFVLCQRQKPCCHRIAIWGSHLGESCGTEGNEYTSRDATKCHKALFVGLDRSTKINQGRIDVCSSRLAATAV